MGYEMFKILVIDDDPMALAIASKTLEKQHYQVILAKNGQEGLEKIFQEAPDIVLLDIMMPRMSGIEVCARLRAGPRTADLPIIMLTAVSDSSTRQQAYQAGADDYITKGEPLQHMDGRIKMLIKQRILAHTRSWLAELPGSVSADQALRALLKANQPLAACYMNIIGLAAFNSLAGFKAGDQILWKLALILRELIKKDEQGDFVGHYGSDNFIVLTSPERAKPIAEWIVREFDAAVADIPQAHAPTLAIGIVIVKDSLMIHPGQIVGLGQSLLQRARAEPGNSFHIAECVPLDPAGG